jgi:hypothetical protein
LYSYTSFTCVSHPFDLTWHQITFRRSKVRSSYISSFQCPRVWAEQKVQQPTGSKRARWVWGSLSSLRANALQMFK